MYGPFLNTIYAWSIIFIHAWSIQLIRVRSILVAYAMHFYLCTSFILILIFIGGTSLFKLIAYSQINFKFSLFFFLQPSYMLLFFNKTPNGFCSFAYAAPFLIGTICLTSFCTYVLIF